MPDGETHYRYYKYNLPVAVAVCTVAFFWVTWFYAAGIAIGYLLGRWIDPDLDQPGLTRAEGRMFRELGFFGSIVAAYWLPYGYIFRRSHRSIWTHFPGLSTAIRMLWALPPVVALAYAIKVPWNSDAAWVVFGIWVGLTMADAVHYTLDIASGEIKIRRKNGKR